MGVGLGGFATAISGLMTTQRGLDVTAHNIANLNTKGYVRQQAMITSSNVQSIGENMQVGMGANIEQIRQLRNEFLDGIYRKEVTQLGYWEAKNKVYEEIQSILGEPTGEGTQDALNEFWDSWQELSKAPESLTVRAAVKQRGEAFVQQVNHMGDRLVKLQNDLNSEVRLRIEEVNDITKEIAKLNLQIGRTELSQDAANDFRDQRNILVDNLLQLIQAEVFESSDGQLDIIVDGNLLVSRGIQQNLEAKLVQGTGLFYAPTVAKTGDVVTFKSGYIQGLLEARGEVKGAVGSIDNGMPNTIADITIAIDTSNTSESYLSKLQDSVIEYVQDLSKRGLDFNLKLLPFAGSIEPIQSFGTDIDAFVAAVQNVSANSTDNENNLTSLVNALTNDDTYRPYANRYAIVFTEESLNGDGTEPITDVTSLVNELQFSNIKMSLVTNTIYHTSGDSSVNETVGWNAITDATGGKTYDLQAMNYKDLYKTINQDMAWDVNYQMSSKDISSNVIADVMKKLNSMVNSVAREVNYVHMSGRTLGDTSTKGTEFFVSTNAAYPIQMGNIKLNDNLRDLNYLVASYDESLGNNEAAVDIANVRYHSILKEQQGIVNSDDYYQTFILTIGNKASESVRMHDSQDKLVQSADTFRQSIMNVSLDEELSNMMRYKFAYSANSKVLQAMDAMLQIVIEKLVR